MSRVTYLVGHDLSVQGMAFICGPHGTAIEHESIDAAILHAKDVNYKNNIGRAEEEKIDIWKVYLLVEV